MCFMWKQGREVNAHGRVAALFRAGCVFLATVCGVEDSRRYRARSSTWLATITHRGLPTGGRDLQPFPGRSGRIGGAWGETFRKGLQTPSGVGVVVFPPSLPGLTRQSRARGRRLMGGRRGAMDARIKSGHDE